ncbi:MAG: DUF4886 domain-containing protein [Clostridia bacterium]|nr:DUF4886 domain-containing protein [Clostridia bacterium]
MKILCIGNSFSTDATRYLHGVAKNAGVNIKTVNLYIGGCSLYTHYINALEDLKNYSLEFNGVTTGFKVSIKEALISDQFDMVTLQQASPFSFKTETYEPYMAFLIEYIRKYLPHTKIFIHQTWGYKPSSARLSQMGFLTHREMYDAVEKSYADAYKKYEFGGFIPSGRAMLNLVETGVPAESIFRDDIHASLGMARYTQALTWLEYLTGTPACDNSFSEFDVPVSDGEIAIAKKAASDACAWANANGYSQK